MIHPVRAIGREHNAQTQLPDDRPRISCITQSGGRMLLVFIYSELPVHAADKHEHISQWRAIDCRINGSGNVQPDSGRRELYIRSDDHCQYPMPGISSLGCPCT